MKTSRRQRPKIKLPKHLLPYIDRTAWRLWNNRANKIGVILTERYPDTLFHSDEAVYQTAATARSLVDRIRHRVKDSITRKLSHRGFIRLRLSDNLFDPNLNRPIEPSYPELQNRGRRMRGMEQAEWTEEWVE